MHFINIILDKIEIMHVDVMTDTEKFKIIKFQDHVVFYFLTKKEQHLFPLSKVNRTNETL